MIQNYLPTDYQNFIALSRYARWKDDEQRRENWGETVDRYFDYMANHLSKNHSDQHQMNGQIARCRCLPCACWAWERCRRPYPASLLVPLGW